MGNGVSCTAAADISNDSEFVCIMCNNKFAEILSSLTFPYAMNTLYA